MSGPVSSPRAGERGVTLGVMAVVVAVAGALVVLANALQHMRAERGRLHALDDRFTAISDSLVEFAMVHKRLPCPADGADARGVEAGAPGACGDQARGTVPWRATALAQATARDRWGRKISYRVAERLTADGALVGLASPYTGLGLAVCGAPACPAPRFDPAAGTGAALVLISHGESGIGGFVAGSGRRVEGEPGSAGERANLGATGPFMDLPPAGGGGSEADAGRFDDRVLGVGLGALLAAARLTVAPAVSARQPEAGNEPPDRL